MVNCFKCGHSACVKNGLMQGQQRFKCKKCGQNFIDKPRRGYGKMATTTAVWLYLNGMPQSKIARMFKVTPTAVQKWIKTVTQTLK